MSRQTKGNKASADTAVVWVALSRVDCGRLTRDRCGMWWEGVRPVPGALAHCLGVLVGAGLVHLDPPAGRTEERAARLTATGRARLLELADERLVTNPRGGPVLPG